LFQKAWKRERLEEGICAASSLKGSARKGKRERERKTGEGASEPSYYLARTLRKKKGRAVQSSRFLRSAVEKKEKKSNRDVDAFFLSSNPG